MKSPLLRDSVFQLGVQPLPGMNSRLPDLVLQPVELSVMASNTNNKIFIMVEMLIEIVRRASLLQSNPTWLHG